MVEPDYTPVTGIEEKDPEENLEYFPSSFLKDEKAVARLCGNSFRSYRLRRRLTGICVFSIFVLAAVIATYEFGRMHGHISGGAGSYLESTEDEDMSGLAKMRASGRRLTISSWNIAAINNNPFEYWITIKDNPKYEELMLNVEKFLEQPGSNDVPVNTVFTDSMFDDLQKKMVDVGLDPNEKVKKYWIESYRDRKIISGFMKDKTLGSKRLASMPDRVTNTINVVGTSEPVCRPTVINMFEGDLSSMDKWWAEWMRFMFQDPLPIKMKTGVESKIPYQLLKTIPKAKYPAISEEEEAISLPLQTMCGAIFDAILVHMMNTVSDPNDWQPLKHLMVENLNRKKVSNTFKILKKSYGINDIIMLQEVSSAFIDEARRELSDYHVVSPKAMDSVKDQNSVILLRKETFPMGSNSEITELIEKAFPAGEDIPVARGDILAITTVDSDNFPYVIASFHGDTNGLATIPVVTAMTNVISAEKGLSEHNFIFGLDANTYEKGLPGVKQDVLEFGKVYVNQGLTSCWGDVPDPKNYTTYNARTYLQPQLNKACKSSEKEMCGDINPKDFILFPKGKFDVIKTWKDNTGEKQYIEKMAFPTLDFPSDHGILSTILKPKK